MKNYILLALDTRSVKKNGTSPLVFRIYDFKKYVTIPTNYSILPKDWDEVKRKVKNSYVGTESVSRLNNFLAKKHASYLDIIMKLDESKELENMTLVQLKSKLSSEEIQIYVFDYIENLIGKFIELNKIGNARVYKGVLNVLKTFRNNKDLTFHELDYDFLKKFEHNFLSKEGNSYNGLSVYLRTIRSVYNKAIKDKLANKEHYPFEEYKIKNEKTKKRAIGIQHIKSIEALNFDSNHPLFHTRHYFLASFYLMGASFTDLAHLKLENIIDGRIKYQRQKTNRQYDIAITPQLEKILSYYISKEKKKNNYIFPIIDRADSLGIYKDVEWARKRFNKKLNKIAQLCSIDQNLTSYVSRHSFATLAKHKGIPVTAISEMLGHGDLKTTQIYLDSLTSNVIDDFHKKILE